MENQHLVNGISIDRESMLIIAEMSEADFKEHAKKRFWVGETEKTQDKWIAELRKLATEVAGQPEPAPEPDTAAKKPAVAPKK